MTVSQHKGERNSPEYLLYILDAVAAIKDLTSIEVAETTSNNAQRLFTRYE